jgi:catechol-2,3-dioxygenase
MQPHAFPTDRRRFLSWVSAAPVFFAAHTCFAAGSKQVSTSQQRAKPGPRIRSLELLSSAPLVHMKAFYHETLGLRVLNEQPARLTFAAGETALTFITAASDNPKPFYHFAFNIPENKIVAARSWQQRHTPLLPIPARLRDPAYPDDVVDYRHWNAHSIFFFDPAGNVVEYIARHDLKNAAPGAFGSADILYASEIGLVVDEVTTTTLRLKETLGIDPYKGGSEQFRALGDEYGLLLVMQRGRVISFDAPETKAVSVFRTVASIRGSQQRTYTFPQFPYRVSVET